MAINTSAFKAYDVRGVYPSEINEETAAATAKALALYLKADRLVVGRDARASSPSLYKSIVKALTEVGVDVIDLGLCPTPLVSYTIAKKGFPGGIMITASHNPPEYNALKLIQSPVFQLSSPGGMDEVKRLALSPSTASMKSDKVGKVESFSILDEYVAEVCDEFVSLKGLRIVADYGNGMGAITAKPVLERLGVEAFHLYDAIDFTFPNHLANPAEEKNLEELEKKVIMLKCDAGIAFDGDADRGFVMDERGKVVPADIMMALIAPSELKGRSEKRVYYDLRSSKILPETVKKNRGEPIMMRVGNPFTKEKLINDGGVFGGELAGHIMFQDHYCLDDGLYAALKALKVLQESRKKLSELVQPLLKYYHTPEINMKVKNPDALMEKVRNAFRDGKSTELDGVYISYNDWWFSLRKSNTEPLLRLRLEADTEEKMRSMRDKIMKMITG
jgi:phosphomannomutase